MPCPKCKESALTAAGPHKGCTQCGGLFVTEAAFGEMLATMSAGAAEPRTLASYPIGTQWCAHLCPECGDVMMSSSIEKLPVERCARHGIWFDKAELERVLAQDVSERGGIGDSGEDALGRVAEVGVAVTVGGALALLVHYIGRVIRRAL